MSAIERSQLGQPIDAGSGAPFPATAPVAPPVPEDLDEPGTDKIQAVESTPPPRSSRAEVQIDKLSEFIWLFEYGLEMDESLLNDPDRLDGAALPYGPAVLKGYQLSFQLPRHHSQQMYITIVPTNERGAEIWGVLYRVPRRCAERREDEPSQLDVLHNALPPETLFEPLHLIVREQQRDREIACLTYIASESARQQFLPLSQIPAGTTTAASIEHFLGTARHQAFPDHYLQRLDLALASADHQNTADALLEEEPHLERHTEELPRVQASSQKRGEPEYEEDEPLPAPLAKGRWMMAFAIYLVVLFPLVLTLAVLQGLGFGGRVFTSAFMPLGVPWFVLVYGLLGGCVSCIISLGQRHTIRLPSFVLITWFTRPLIGSVLAALVFQMLNSGVFALGTGGGHDALFSLIGVLAGLCEGWIFYRRIS